jgi:CheY-like chemotaxis protein
MGAPTVGQDIKAKSEKDAAKSGQNGIERRRRRRAKISAQVRVRSANLSDKFEEICMSVDVSRDGLLFTSKTKGYWKGQPLRVTFPFSSDSAEMNLGQVAEVVRVIQQPGGNFSVAVHFETAAVDAKLDLKRVSVAPATSDVAKPQPKQQPMVLAIEPDTRTAEIMRNMLQQDGYNVVIVSTAQEALDILRTTVPAAFIAEVEATDMSGQDLCLIIKRNERLQGVPVILLTRSAQPADYSASHKMGAVVCMAKPFQPERLQHVIRLVAPPPVVRSAYATSRNMHSSIERAL